MASTPTISTASLKKAQYINLTTFRKSGEGVATPVWFAEHDSQLFVFTFIKTGKVKRVRNSDRVTVASCNARGVVKGPTIAGTATLLESEAERVAARQVLQRKYGLIWRVWQLFAIRGKLAQTTIIAITPTPAIQ